MPAPFYIQHSCSFWSHILGRNSKESILLTKTKTFTSMCGKNIKWQIQFPHVVFKRQKHLGEVCPGASDGLCFVLRYALLQTLQVIATETVEIHPLQPWPALNDDLTHWNLFGVMCINSSSQWHGILFILMALTLDGTLLVIKWLLYFQHKQDNCMLFYVTSANVHRLGQIGGWGWGHDPSWIKKKHS